MPAKQATDYLYIRAWCEMMGSYPYFVTDQIEKARATRAPETAIYEKYADDGSGPTGEWETYENVSNPMTRERIDSIIRRRTES
jgi:predicted DNA-binding transcriptional regulator YafY